MGVFPERDTPTRITSAAARPLADWPSSCASAKLIAFDTEFVSEHTYRPVLCLIQVAADGELAAGEARTVEVAGKILGLSDDAIHAGIRAAR